MKDQYGDVKLFELERIKKMYTHPLVSVTAVAVVQGSFPERIKTDPNAYALAITTLLVALGVLMAGGGASDEEVQAALKLVSDEYSEETKTMETMVTSKELDGKPVDQWNPQGLRLVVDNKVN